MVDVIMLSVITLSIVMPNGIILSVLILSNVMMNVVTLTISDEKSFIIFPLGHRLTTERPRNAGTDVIKLFGHKFSFLQQKKVGARGSFHNTLYF